MEPRPTNATRPPTTPPTRPRPRPRRRALVAAAVVAALALVAVACGSDDSGGSAEPSDSTAAAPTTSRPSGGGPSSGPGSPAPQPLAETVSIKVAIPLVGSEPYLPGLLADTIGEFEKENLDVTFEVLPIPETLVLMEQGQVQVFPAGYYGGLFNTIHQGGEMRAVTGLGFVPEQSLSGLWVDDELARPDGTVDPCDLRGATVSFGGSAGLGATSTYWIGQFLAECPEALTVKDVQVSTLGGPDLLAAMESGAVTGGFLYDPIWTDAEEKGYAVLAVKQYPEAMGGWMFSGSFMEEEPEAAEAFVRAMLRTVRTYLDGDYRATATPEVRAAILEALQLPEDVYDKGFSFVFDPDMPPAIEPILGLQEAWLEVGGILAYDQPLPTSDIVDTRILDAVLAE